MTYSSAPLPAGRELLVSVLVPIYNHATYVEACLDSVAAQDYASVELIVIDDGSADASAARVDAWLAKHTDRFVRVVFETQANAGLVVTLNRLVGLAQGEIIAPIASDDMLLPGALRFRVGVLEANPEALALFTDCTVVDAAGHQLHRSGISGFHGKDIRLMRNGDLVVSLLLLHFCVPGPVFTARRAAYDPAIGVGLYDPEHYPEDLDFYLRLAQTRRLLFQPRATAAYRVHGENSIYQQGLRIHEGIREILDTHAPALPPYERTLARLYSRASVPPEKWPWRKRTPAEIGSRVAMEAIRSVYRLRATLSSVWSRTN